MIKYLEKKVFFERHDTLCPDKDKRENNITVENLLRHQGDSQIVQATPCSAR